MSDDELDNIQENGDEQKICRDYQRGVCRRVQCKFKHDITTPLDGSKVVFCHDFQNNSCTRINCKFMHYSMAEEELYRRTGKLPRHAESRMRDIENGGPACKDYILGTCRRGRDCKYRHITYAEFQQENGLDQDRNFIREPRLERNLLWTRDRENHCRLYTNNSDDGFSPTNDHEPIFERRPVHRTIYSEGFDSMLRRNAYDSYQPPAKKRYFNIEDGMNGRDMYYTRSEQRTIMVEEENTLLRKELDDLKKQLSDLSATNEFLLEQNAQLRMGTPRQGNVTAVTVPAVTITNTTMPPTTQPPTQMIRTVTASVATVPVSIAAVSMAPVQVAAPIVSMATPQTQIITNSAPLAITNNSQGQQIAIAQQTLTNPSAPTQIIASSAQQQLIANTTQIAMAASQPTTQQILTPIGGPTTQQLAIAHNTSQALAMSNATQPIISYPIMTQSILPH